MNYVEEAKKKADEQRTRQQAEIDKQNRERQWMSDSITNAKCLLKESLMQFDGQLNFSYKKVNGDNAFCHLMDGKEVLLTFIIGWTSWDFKYDKDSLTEREEGVLIKTIYHRERDYSHMRSQTKIDESCAVLPENAVKYCMQSVSSYLSKWF